MGRGLYWQARVSDGRSLQHNHCSDIQFEHPKDNRIAKGYHFRFSYTTLVDSPCSVRDVQQDQAIQSPSQIPMSDDAHAAEPPPLKCRRTNIQAGGVVLIKGASSGLALSSKTQVGLPAMSDKALEAKRKSLPVTHGTPLTCKFHPPPCVSFSLPVRSSD